MAVNSLLLVTLLVLLSACGAWRPATSSRANVNSRSFGKKYVSSAAVALGIFGLGSGIVMPSPAMAKTELPALEKCFNAVRKELDPKLGGESLTRLQKDIDTENWDDMRLFTREYDAGFRGGVLKSVWKQLEGAQVSTGSGCVLLIGLARVLFGLGLAGLLVGLIGMRLPGPALGDLRLPGTLQASVRVKHDLDLKKNNPTHHDLFCFAFNSIQLFALTNRLAFS